MICIVETFRSYANAQRLAAVLRGHGIHCRVHAQGYGAVWNVFVYPSDHDDAYSLSLATIYV